MPRAIAARDAGRLLADPRSAALRTARAVPKCISSARLRPGPMPGTSSSGLAVKLLARFWPVGADREAVRLVAQPLEVEEQRRIGREGDLAAAGQVEDLAPGIAVRPLGDADHRHVVDAGILQHLADRARAGPCRRRSAAGPAIRPCERSGSSFSSRAKRRPSTSRIIAKSSPGAVSGRLMLNLR